ncbi:MAG: DNA primase [Cyanophyceae cyanobacterium]
MRLHPSTIEAVKERGDIVDVVSERVALKKQGRDLVGLCPFHDDKSPSFTVSPAKQFYYCFSCGAGGNSIKFLMELDKRSFTDVVMDLAQKYQVPVQTVEPEQRQELQRQLSERDRLYEVMAIACKFFEHALHQVQGHHALTYLTEKRQLTPDVIQQFQLGYAPGGWDTLFRYLTEQKQFPVSIVEAAGLVVPRKSGQGFYDRFRDRLMIPICDPQGRVIGFGGRGLTDDAKPKYLNSPETTLFDKGRTLFGLDKAKQAIASRDGAIVVEGYFDVIALHAAGLNNAVAALGTALSAAQVKLLLRFTESKRVVLNFDADGAGQKATERAIGELETLAYNGDVQLRVLNLPGGKDADEFLKNHSPSSYFQLLDDAPLWLDWQIELALQGQDLRQGDQFQGAIAALVKLLGKLPNPALRSHYTRVCAERLGMQDSRFTLQLERDLRSQVKGQRWQGRSKKWQRPADTSLRQEAEAELLQIYLHCPDYRPMVRAVLEERELEFGMSHHRFLWRQILRLEQSQATLGSGDEALDFRTELLSSPEFSREDLLPIQPLLNLDEIGRLDLARPELSVRSATAAMESLACAKRCRYLLDAWLNAYLHYQVLTQKYQEFLESGELDLDFFTPDEGAVSPLTKVIDLKTRRQIGGNAPASQGSLALASQAEPLIRDEAELEAALDKAFNQQQGHLDDYSRDRQYLHQLTQQRQTTYDDLTKYPVATDLNTITDDESE